MKIAFIFTKQDVFQGHWNVTIPISLERSHSYQYGQRLHQKHLLHRNGHNLYMRFISSTSKKFCLKIVYYYFLFSFFLQVRLKRIFHFDKKFMKCKLPAFWTLCYERIQVRKTGRQFDCQQKSFKYSNLCHFFSWHQ